MICLLIFAVSFAAVRAASSEEKLVAGNLTSTGTEQVGWVSSRPGRSTSEIIWSCFTVLLVCTYKCIHLNLPSLEETTAGWHRICGVPIWPERPLLKKNLRQVKWMACILLAPEYGVAIAFRQYGAAKAMAARTHLGQQMSLAHGFFAIMGGFVAECSSLSQNEGDGLLRKTVSYRKTLTLEEYLSQCERNNDLVVTEADIQDRNKADAFTKVFAIAQSTWLVTQCVSRAILGLSITELELTTVAYIFCALIMYAFWWDKPFGVEQPIIVRCDDDGTNSDTRFVRHKMIEEDDFTQLFWFEEGSGFRRQLVFYASATIFSSIHFFAWNWEFPNYGAALAWKICAVLATVIGPLLMIMSFFNLKYSRGYTVISALYFPLLILYFLARLGLITLVFYAFKAMPVGVYKTVEWSEYFPHFS